MGSQNPIADAARSIPRTASEPFVKAGVCYALFAYDIAFAINLDDAERMLTGVKHRETIRPHRRVPRSLQYQSAPLRITEVAEPISIAGFTSASTVDALIYDFGAVSIMYSIPLRGPLDRVLELGTALYDHTALFTDSRQRVEQLMAMVRGALVKPGISEEIEDYLVYHIAAFDPPWPIERLLAERGDVLARILRSEPGPLSQEEVHDALAQRVSYTPHDTALIDWNGAMVIDAECDDVRAVLEFANVELLEMRFLDRRLDGSLDAAYAALNRRGWWRLRGMRTEVRRIAQLQADGAVLFEGVTNFLKLVGDQYLARVYRTASARLHRADWDATILRKLQTLESIYDKLTDQQAARRMELLEWIIIILIAVSIAISMYA